MAGIDTRIGEALMLNGLRLAEKVQVMTSKAKVENGFEKARDGICFVRDFNAVNKSTKDSLSIGWYSQCSLDGTCDEVLFILSFL